MKGSGRTVFIFLILIVIILISGISISLYLLNQETQGRKTAESALEDIRVKASKLEDSLKDAQKQVEVLAGKNKDADDKINSLLDEIEVEKGLRDEVKKESQKLKETLEAEAKSKLELREKMSKDLADAQTKLDELQKQAAGHGDEVSALQQKLADLEDRNRTLTKQLTDLNEGITARDERSEFIPPSEQAMASKVDLDRIVVTPDSAREGKVLNIDTDTEFLIFDLGSKNGIAQGNIMSIYRGKAYLGDVRVTRVQEEMSAADFIPPFSSRKVRKNDLVVPKR